MREPQQVLKAFKAIDTDNSGDICTAEFRAVVKRMDFGVNDVDDKVWGSVGGSVWERGKDARSVRTLYNII